MKKIILLLAAAAVFSAMYSCKDEDENNNNNNRQPEEEVDELLKIRYNIIRYELRDFRDTHGWDWDRDWDWDHDSIRISGDTMFCNFHSLITLSAGDFSILNFWDTAVFAYPLVIKGDTAMKRAYVMAIIPEPDTVVAPYDGSRSKSVDLWFYLTGIPKKKPFHFNIESAGRGIWIYYNIDASRDTSFCLKPIKVY